jgi:hypothetical protein
MLFGAQKKQKEKKYIYIVFVTGEDDIARFDSRRYNDHEI